MAEVRRTTARRRTSSHAQSIRRGTAYVEGNTVRKLREAPQRGTPSREEVERRRKEAERRARAKKRKEAERRASRRAEMEAQPLSRRAQQNRQKAAGMNRGFVVFIAVICVAILGFCVYYLQLKSEITASIRRVASLEAEYNQLKEDNDAYYSQVTSNVDMSTIKKIAIGRLGMKNPSEGQTETYTTARSSYLRQYQDLADLE